MCIEQDAQVKRRVQHCYCCCLSPQQIQERVPMSGAPTSCCGASGQARLLQASEKKFGFFSIACCLDCWGLGKEELFSVVCLVQSFADESFLIFPDMQLNCHELCMYLYFKNKYPTRIQQQKCDLNKNQIQKQHYDFNPQLALCFPQGFDDA